MNLYQTQTEFNGGIDLHTRNMYLCIMNREGRIMVHKKIRENSLDYLRELLAPYKGQLTLCCESTPNWYFLHDFCIQEGIDFALGHALYVRAIAQNKHKNDKLDSQRLADLLRTNLLPVGYACPRGQRELRDLLRRRALLIEKRSALKASLTMSTHMYGYEELSKSEKSPSKRHEALTKRSDCELIETWYTSYMETIEEMDRQVKRIEKLVYDRTKNKFEKELQVLESIPGIGRILALTILLEIVDIQRFPSVQDFASYARLIVPEGESSGKKCGKRNRKIGNAHLSWAFGQVGIYAAIHNPSIKRYFEYLEQKRKRRSSARAVLAHRIGRAVYHMLKKGTLFDLQTFFSGKTSMIVKN